MKTINNSFGGRLRGDWRLWLSRCWLIGGLLVTGLLLTKAGAQWSASSSPARRSTDATHPLGVKTKNIEGMRPDETVMAFDFASEQWRPCRVLRLLEHDYQGDVITIGLEADTISATGNHPFWVIQGEDLPTRPFPADIKENATDNIESGRWVEARDLRVGDRLRVLGDAIAVVSSLSSRWDSLPVYNLEVEDLHTYAVGLAQVLVHNKSPGKPTAAPKNGETPSTARGRQAHEEHDYGPGFEKEHRLPSGKRADAVNLETGEVVELKPNNERAIRRGEKQVEEYRKELEEKFEKLFSGRVETYDQ